jgi:hypothetical protein
VKKKTQFCVNWHGVFWVYEDYFLPATFSAHRMFDCLILFLLLYLHICLPIRGCRMCRAWIVSWCDMHRLYNWYNAFEACTKTWYFHIRYFSFCLYINHIVYTHCLRLHIISRHNISYHFILYLVISCHIMSYHIISYHTRIISWFF